MFKFINHWSTFAFVTMISTLLVSPLYAQDGGMSDLKEQASEQGGAFVQTILILVFAAGVVFLVLGVIGIRKINKEQMPDDKKSGVWFNMIVGILATAIPFILALGQGILGVTGEEAPATQDTDWGLGN